MSSNEYIPSNNFYWHRASTCHVCPNKCDRADCDLDHPKFVCPIGLFGEETLYKINGLGDVVAVIANPIGDMIGLDKSKCGCNDRQKFLNNLVPIKLFPQK